MDYIVCCSKLSLKMFHGIKMDPKTNICTNFYLLSIHFSRQSIFFFCSIYFLFEGSQEVVIILKNRCIKREITSYFLANSVLVSWKKIYNGDM
jgi:hypothetical protein